MFKLNKDYLYAVVGASANKEKYGYKVLVDLNSKGFRVVGINPNYEQIENIKCFKSLKDVPQKIDVVILIVPANVGINILKECVLLKINKIWIQPGAESSQIINFCKENSLDCVYNSCIMLSSSKNKF
jgi:predicted CoA-binding protein